MKQYTRPILGAVVAAALAGCSSDAGISSADKGGGGAATGSGGSTGAAGRTSGGAGGSAMPPVNPDFGFNRDAGASAAGGATGAGGMPGEEKTCGQVTHKLERLLPEILLVLDRSSSMKEKVQNSQNSRWVEISAAIVDVLGQTDGKVHWGLKNFPTMSGCSVSNTVEVEVVPTTKPVADAVIATMPNDGQGGTPTGAAMRAATGYLRTRTTKNPKYIVLATDGEPTCRDMPLESINEAKAAGFKTFVVGIATAGTGEDRTLDEMAVAGGEARQGMPRYYPVENRKDFVDTVSAIAVRVSNCVFPLDMEPPVPENVRVKADGNVVARDMAQANGWNYGAGMRNIQIYGPICEQLKAGLIADVQITFGCPNKPIE